MSNHPAFVTAVALVLASCSSGPPALPEDIAGSATTCAVVSASQARSAIQDPLTPLSLEQQSQIIHYALLAGAADPGFSRENANAVVKGMQMVADRITGDKWKPLVPLCKTAFPEADLGQAVTLPAADDQAQLQCYALGDFMVRALGAYDETYREAVAKYNGTLTKLDPTVKEILAKQGIKPEDNKAQSAEKSKALAIAAKLGPPTKTMDACMQRFPIDTEIKLPTAKE
jgi:hypothetical protein